MPKFAKGSKEAKEWGAMMKAKRGHKSKTHPGELDYTTKKGDKFFHRGHHLETMRGGAFTDFAGDAPSVAIGTAGNTNNGVMRVPMAHSKYQVDGQFKRAMFGTGPKLNDEARRAKKEEETGFVYVPRPRRDIDKPVMVPGLGEWDPKDIYAERNLHPHKPKGQTLADYLSGIRHSVGWNQLKYTMVPSMFHEGSPDYLWKKKDTFMPQYTQTWTDEGVPKTPQDYKREYRAQFGKGVNKTPQQLMREYEASYGRGSENFRDSQELHSFHHLGVHRPVVMGNGIIDQTNSSWVAQTYNGQNLGAHGRVSL